MMCLHPRKTLRWRRRETPSLIAWQCDDCGENAAGPGQWLPHIALTPEQLRDAPDWLDGDPAQGGLL